MTYKPWLLLALVGILACSVSAISKNPESFPAVEELSFEIKKFPVDQQGPQVLDVKASFRYKPGIGDKEYPDFEVVYKDICARMTKYPNKKDYWEVFNRNIATALLKDYPTFTSVKLEMVVYPTYGIQYSHTSTCTVAR
jgi:hypothetical protein